MKGAAQLVTSLWPHALHDSLLASLPAGAFWLCMRAARWIESEVSDEAKRSLTKSLQSASWRGYLDKAYLEFGLLLDKGLGPRLLSWRMFICSVVISLIGILGFVSASAIVDTDYAMSPDWIRVVWFRASVAIPFDFATFLRVRYYCRHVYRSRLLLDILTSVILDWLVFLAVLYITLVFDFFYLGYSGTGSSSWALNLFGTIAFVARMLLDYVSGNGSNTEINYARVIIVCGPALLPSLLFYAFTFALVVLKTILFISHPVAAGSKHLRFTRPFMVIGTIAGAVLFVLTLIVEWLIGPMQ